MTGFLRSGFQKVKRFLRIKCLRVIDKIHAKPPSSFCRAVEGALKTLPSIVDTWIRSLINSGSWLSPSYHERNDVRSNFPLQLSVPRRVCREVRTLRQGECDSSFNVCGTVVVNTMQPYCIQTAWPPCRWRVCRYGNRNQSVGIGRNQPYTMEATSSAT